MPSDFSHNSLGRLGSRVCRLGLSTTYRPGKEAVHRAMDAGVNLFFGFGMDGQMMRTVREMSSGERERFVVVTGAYNLLVNRRPNLRKVLEKRLRQLRTDYLDLFMWLGVLKPEHLSEWTKDEMRRLREEGKVRGVGISCHDRRLLGRLAGEGAIDGMMVRYNGAHRGAEEEVFPFLEEHDPAVISYTATRWSLLLRRPRGWPRDGWVPDPRACYRFVLSNPHVHCVLSAPANLKQLEENLGALEQGPLDEGEMTRMRAFGDAVHDARKWFM